MIFVILLTPAPFSADTKNTLIPNLKTPKNIKFRFYSHQHTNSLFCHQAENVDTGTAGGVGDKYQVSHYRPEVFEFLRLFNLLRILPHAAVRVNIIQALPGHDLASPGY